VIEEHDSFSGIVSAVEAGTGVTLGFDVLGHSSKPRKALAYHS